jgi:hypothetical protein
LRDAGSQRSGTRAGGPGHDILNVRNILAYPTNKLVQVMNTHDVVVAGAAVFFENGAENGVGWLRCQNANASVLTGVYFSPL